MNKGVSLHPIFIKVHFSATMDLILTLSGLADYPEIQVKKPFYGTTRKHAGFCGF